MRTSWVVSAELHPPACPAAAAGLTHSCLFASDQNQTVQFLFLFITWLFKHEALWRCIKTETTLYSWLWCFKSSWFLEARPTAWGENWFCNIFFVLLRVYPSHDTDTFNDRAFSDLLSVFIWFVTRAAVSALQLVHCRLVSSLVPLTTPHAASCWRLTWVLPPTAAAHTQDFWFGECSL